MSIGPIHHVAIVVHSIDEALPRYRELLGLEAEAPPMTFAPQRVRLVFLPTGPEPSARLELVEPIDDESGVARYLASHGEGVHHLCFLTDDLPSSLDALARADPNFSATLRVQLSRPPFEAQPGSPLVAAVRNVTTQVLGHEPETVGETPWMDSALLAAAGVDTVVMGPHGEGAHAAVEWVDVESVEALARILAQTALDYCC